MEEMKLVYVLTDEDGMASVFSKFIDASRYSGSSDKRFCWTITEIDKDVIKPKKKYWVGSIKYEYKSLLYDEIEVIEDRCSGELSEKQAMVAFMQSFVCFANKKKGYNREVRFIDIDVKLVEE